MNRQGRILVVDDLEKWRKQLVEALQREGFYTDSASTATEALERLYQSFYHVLVIDIRMNETDQSNIDGIDLLRELDKRGGQPRLREVGALGRFTLRSTLRLPELPPVVVLFPWQGCRGRGSIRPGRPARPRPWKMTA